MKTILKFASAAFAALCLASASQAITWTVQHGTTVNNGTYLDFLYSGDTTYSNTFNLGTVGFIAGIHEITSGEMAFYFADDENDGPEYVRFTFENGAFGPYGDYEVNGSHGGGFDTVNFTISSPSGIASLQDGLFQYTVRRVSGDTYLKGAVLTAYGHRKQVPDGGATFALMALGLGGLVAARKRMR